MSGNRIMKIGAQKILGGCVSVVLLLGVSACKNQDQERPAVSDEQNRETARRAALGQYDRPPEKMSPAQGVVFREAPLLAKDLLKPETSATTALSPEEAHWLEKHGYPTQKELDGLMSMDVVELERASRDRGDGRATMLLGSRQFAEGKYRDASFTLALAAKRGSIYARELHAIAKLKDFMNGSGAQFPGDAKSLFVAQMEVARLLGDHRVDAYIREYAGDLNRSVYGPQIISQTAEYMRQYAEDLQLRKQPPPVIDLRPNADLWAKAEQSPQDATINAYVR